MSEAGRLVFLTPRMVEAITGVRPWRDGAPTPATRAAQEAADEIRRAYDSSPWIGSFHHAPESVDMGALVAEFQTAWRESA